MGLRISLQAKNDLQRTTGLQKLLDICYTDIISNDFSFTVDLGIEQKLNL